MPRGSAPGERRGGRVKGTPNKDTEYLKGLAQQHTERAVLALADVLGDSDAPAIARVKAAEALLDRGFGKPRQMVDAEVKGDLRVTIMRFAEAAAGDG